MSITLVQPAIGSTGWGLDVNNNWAKIQAAFINPNYIIVVPIGDSTADGTALLAAYAAATELTPNGSALSATNRATLFVMPGVYDLASTPLTLDTEFVDIQGMSANPDDIWLESDSKTVIQTANDVWISNLRIHTNDSTSAIAYTSDDVAAYFPDAALSATRLINVTCSATNDGINAWSMRLIVEYAGLYFKCSCELRAFGFGSNFSGIAQGCTAGDYSYASYGTLNGTTIDCTAGDFSFGYFITFSGTAINCTGGVGAFAGYGTFSGKAQNCIGGINAFGGFGGTFTGTAINCNGGPNAFGGSGVFGGTATGCAGGDGAFGGGGGTFYGQAINCTFLSWTNAVAPTGNGAYVWCYATSPGTWLHTAVSTGVPGV